MHSCACAVSAQLTLCWCRKVAQQREHQQAELLPCIQDTLPPTAGAAIMPCPLAGATSLPLPLNLRNGQSARVGSAGACSPGARWLMR